MRIKVKGRIDLTEIDKVSEKVFEYLSKYGITETRDITFYFTILDPETNQRAGLMFPNSGEEIDGWTFEDPNKTVINKESNLIEGDFHDNN